MPTTDRRASIAHPPSSRLARVARVATPPLALVATAFAIAFGCSYEKSTDVVTFHDAATSADSEAQVVEVGEEGGLVGLSPLCGVEPNCDPDLPAFCDRGDAGTAGAGDGFIPQVDGAHVDAGLDAHGAGGAGGAGGADARSDGGEDACGGGGTTLACRVVRVSMPGAPGDRGDDGALRETLTTKCAPAGRGRELSWCCGDGDCGPGLACAGDPGRCLRYCCKGSVSGGDPCDPTDDAGPPTHYCTPLPVAGRPKDKVPVCAKLDHCKLLEDEASCPKGSGCSVVRNDGATTCVPVGAGRECQPCPCERGYVCLGSADSRLCRKLCREGDDSACPRGGACESLPSIPKGFGICSVDPKTCK